jgi:hypothetical protein
MCEPFLLDLSGRGVEQSDLLKLGMEIYSLYLACNCPISRSRASWGSDRVSAGGRSSP